MTTRTALITPDHHAVLYEGVRKAIDTWRNEASTLELTDTEALESLTRFVMGGVAASLLEHDLVVATISDSERDLRLAWPFLMQLIEDEWPNGVVAAVRTWTLADDNQVGAVQRLHEKFGPIVFGGDVVLKSDSPTEGGSV